VYLSKLEGKGDADVDKREKVRRGEEGSKHTPPNKVQRIE
jgi:hypothetical protein